MTPFEPVPNQVLPRVSNERNPLPGAFRNANAKKEKKQQTLVRQPPSLVVKSGSSRHAETKSTREYRDREKVRNLRPTPHGESAAPV